MWLWLILACKKDDQDGGSSIVENVNAEVTDVGTVVRVTFDTKEAASATVRFGPGDLRYETPATEEGTHHEVLLVGLPALTEAHYQIVVGDETDEEGTIGTGIIDPVLFQPLTITGDGHDLFAAVAMLPATRVAILDPEGRYVWTHIDERGGYFSYRLRLLRDGLGVVYNIANVSGQPTSEGTGLVKVPFDSLEETFLPVDYLAHDFVELEDGTFAVIAFEERPLPDECADLYEDLKPPKTSLLGNRIVEVAPDGTQTEVWDSWDCFDPCVDLSDSCT